MIKEAAEDEAEGSSRRRHMQSLILTFFRVWRGHTDNDVIESGFWIAQSGDHCTLTS